MSGCWLPSQGLLISSKRRKRRLGLGPASSPSKRQKQTHKQNQKTPKGPSDQSLCSLGSSTWSFMTLSVPDPQFRCHHHGNLGYTVGCEEEIRFFAASLGDGVRKANGLALLLSFRLTRSPLIRISGGNTHIHLSMGVSAFSYQPCVTPSSSRLFRQSEWILVTISQQVRCRSRAWCWYRCVWGIRQLCQELLFHPDYDKTYPSCL